MDREPRFAQFLRSHLPGVTLETLGVTQGWAAPFSIIDAPDGFGEEVWDSVRTEAVIAILLAGGEVHSEVPGARGRRVRSSQRRVTIQPMGQLDHYRARDPVRFAHFYISDRLLQRVAEGLNLPHVAQDSLRPDLVMVEDALLWRGVRDYGRRALDRREPPSRVEMEGRALLIVERLLSIHHGARPAPSKGGLAPWQVRRTCDAMEAHLDAALGLDDLAAIAGCSPAHFSRAFKQTTGVSPSRWLEDRRVEKAKEMLVGTETPLSAVATAVGYAAQPQFTAAFSRATGMPPGRWRRLGRV